MPLIKLFNFWSALSRSVGLDGHCRSFPSERTLFYSTCTSLQGKAVGVGSPEPRLPHHSNWSHCRVIEGTWKPCECSGSWQGQVQTFPAAWAKKGVNGEGWTVPSWTHLEPELPCGVGDYMRGLMLFVCKAWKQIPAVEQLKSQNSVALDIAQDSLLL